DRQDGFRTEDGDPPVVVFAAGGRAAGEEARRPAGAEARSEARSLVVGQPVGPKMDSGGRGADRFERGGGDSGRDASAGGEAGRYRAAAGVSEARREGGFAAVVSGSVGDPSEPAAGVRSQAEGVRLAAGKSGPSAAEHDRSVGA